MKKKLLLLIMMLPMLAHADEGGTCGDNLTWTYYESTHSLVLAGNGAMNNYYYNGAPWSKYHSDIVSVTLPEGLTSIGNTAFEDCSGLTSVTIPNSVTSIGDEAFRDCSCLTSVTIGNSVTSIGNEAFSYCSGLTSVTIPNSVTSIGKWAFSFCGLTSVTIGNSVTSIGDHAFNSNDFTSLTIPNSVTSIGDNAFSFCGLTSVTIPNSVAQIGEAAFYGCSSLSTLTLPEEIKQIKKSTFNGCKIKSIVIPAKVEYIYTYAFACDSIQEVKVLASTPPWAHDNAFKNYDIPLYVPTESINSYQSTNPWSKFSSLKSISGEDVDNKCKTPTISYQNGKLSFSSETEGATFHYTITDTDIKSGNGSEVNLSVTYTISVYAIKSGCQNSDVVTGTLCWIDVEPKKEGITDGIANVTANAVLIQSNGGVLNIQGINDGTQISVYSVNGTLASSAVSSDGSAVINTNLQPGSIAIVKIGVKSVKVVVK